MPSMTSQRCGNLLLLLATASAISAAHAGSSSSSSSNAPSVVSSALAYEGGCFVSSEALMCQGGGGDLPGKNNDETAYISDFYVETDFDEDVNDEQEDEDDDDDDDNDGHSSMLSNASLHRSRRVHVSAGRADAAPSFSTAKSNAFVPSSGITFESEITLKQQPQGSAASKALLVRGGAAAPAVGNELAKKLLVSAIVTLVFEGCIGHVLEFFKIVMQTSPAGTTYGQVYNDITSEKGITGLWDGFIPWGVIQSVLKGGVFGLAHATASKYLVPMAKEGKLPMALALTMAGGIGGGFQGYVLSPTLLMKTRVMTNPVFREQMSLLKTTWLSLLIGFEVVQKEGFMTLMKGSNVFATKRVFDWSTRYFFSDLFETFFVGLKGAALTTVEKGASSLLGGVASTILTLPLDVLVAKTQDAKKAGVKVSPIKLFMDEFNETGWKGLRESNLRGFEARLLHVCLTTLVIKTGTPIAYNMMFGPKPN